MKEITSDQWGPFTGAHAGLSYGAAMHYLICGTPLVLVRKARWFRWKESSPGSCAALFTRRTDSSTPLGLMVGAITRSRTGASTECVTPGEKGAKTQRFQGPLQRFADRLHHQARSGLHQEGEEFLRTGLELRIRQAIRLAGVLDQETGQPGARPGKGPFGHPARRGKIDLRGDARSRTGHATVPADAPEG